ncbi:hypothetical protein [Tsuneonella amylolytica]|nr:hypothetical protein [Tsuneonella amylolytica]
MTRTSSNLFAAMAAIVLTIVTFQQTIAVPAPVSTTASAPVLA